MAAIFLSYRRSDSPQACRVYDWLTRRFGNDAVFMDVANIPFATRFTDYIKQEIATSSILVALIGDGWQEKLARPEDAVLMEVETAVANNIPVLPVLIGAAPMPDADTLPASIASLAYQNASTVGVSRDFDTHMQALVPKIEAILGRLSNQSVVTTDPHVVSRACNGVVCFIKDQIDLFTGGSAVWIVLGTADFPTFTYASLAVTLSLHRVTKLAESLELHFILSFWAPFADGEQVLAGQVMHQLEQTPVIPDKFMEKLCGPVGWSLKIRHSDEDARQIWKMITDQPLRLSLAYIATVSPKPTDIATH
jgi:hypothetical protein